LIHDGIFERKNRRSTDRRFFCIGGASLNFWYESRPEAWPSAVDLALPEAVSLREYRHARAIGAPA